MTPSSSSKKDASEMPTTAQVFAFFEMRCKGRTWEVRPFINVVVRRANSSTIYLRELGYERDCRLEPRLDEEEGNDAKQ